MLKVLELFGGIGACTSALKRLPIDFEVVDYVEIDKYAVKSYNTLNNTNYKPQDMQQWDKNIDVDLIMHGSPCQDFSIAGNNLGGNKDSGTRSSLMYETLRIVEKLKPRYVIWENVKNILSKKHKHNFDNYLNFMQELGYDNFYQVLNAKDYGVPQNRERVFTVSVLDKSSHFEFPKQIHLTKTVFDLIDLEVDKKFYLTPEQIERVKTTTFVSERARIKNKEIMRTLRARDYKGPQCINLDLVADFRYDEGLRFRDRNISPCLVAKSATTKSVRSTPLIFKSGDNFRKLTPLEYWRLMGFTDEEFHKAEKVNSNAQLYKQAGNSIVVDVLEKILYNLLIKNYN